MIRVAAIIALAGLAAGCGTAPKLTRASRPTTLAGTLGYPLASAQGQTVGPLIEPPSAPAAPPAPKGRCDAPSLVYLIGRPRTEIPVPADLSHRRVACTTCAPAGDYRPDRTNILFDANTGIITAVTCG